VSRNNSFQKRPPKKEAKHRINNYITAPRVRLVSDEVNDVVSLREAMDIAAAAGLDLVEISPMADPPVCKVMDYSKFMYQQKLREKENKKGGAEMKEVRFGQNISDHDFDTKSAQVIKFLKAGSKVRTSVQFRGRQMAHKEQGELVLLKLAQLCEPYGKPEALPKLEGKKMFMMLSPAKGKKNEGQG
jgi:translation initiation factor IF-3